MGKAFNRYGRSRAAVGKHGTWYRASSTSSRRMYRRLAGGGAQHVLECGGPSEEH